MNAEELFEEAGLTEEYRSELTAFYHPYFESDDELNKFFYYIFLNDNKNKKLRWMMYDIIWFVSLADDIDTIRPGKDLLRILFFRICIEALQKDSGATDSVFFKKFESSFSAAGKQYILSHFAFSGIDVPDGLVGFNSHKGYQLTLMDFLWIIRAMRNMVVHDGDYWSMVFFARDNEFTWLTSLTTDDQIISCQPKTKGLTYNFETTLQYDQFRFYFVEACLNYLKSYFV